MNLFNWLPQSLIVRLYKNIIRNADASFDFAVGRNTTMASLMRLRQLGFEPSTVLDIGAYEGKWSAAAASIFPFALYHLCEALEEKRNILEQLTLPLNRSIHISMLGSENREAIPYFSMASGSGVFPELSDIQRSTILLPMRRLDHVVDKNQKGPILMKMDVQGYELEVLAGAGHLLDNTEVILMECSVVPFNAQAPLIVDVLKALDSLGFLLFDIAEMHRKASDSALVQVDLVFVKRQSQWAQKAANLRGNLSVFTV